jgi:hypothetical protein
MDFTIEIFGILVKAPVPLWIACVLVCIFTLSCAIRLFLKAQPIIRMLKRLTKNINAVDPKDKSIDQAGFNEIDEALSQEPIISDIWNEFKETLLFSNDSQKVSIFNTRQADEYFSLNAIVGGRLNLRFYGALPGILTSLGLLVTFVAILIGLSHIAPSGGAANGPLTGVEELVSSLSGKFISSITALVMAVFFSFFEKNYESKLNTAAHGFVRALNKRFVRKPVEDILQAIQKDVQEQALVLRQFGADLSGRLKESLSESMGPHFIKVAEALDELKRQKSESLTDSLGQIISEFKSALMGSASTEFQTLGASLSKAADMMGAMNIQSQETQQKMAEVIQNLDATMMKQANAGSEQIARLAATMQGVVLQLESTAAQNSGSMTNTVTQLLENMNKSSAIHAAEMAKRNEELAALMKGMLEQMQLSFNQSSSAVSTTVSDVINKSSEWNEKTTAQIAAVMEEQTKNTRAVTEARDSLMNALDIFKRAVVDGSNTLGQLGVMSTSVKEGSTALSSALTNLSKTHDRVGDITGHLGQNAQNLHVVIERQAEIVGGYERIVNDLDKALSGVLGQVVTGVENYSNKVKSGLEESLGIFDNHLSTATNKLGGVVELLTENLDDFTESLDDFNSKLIELVKQATAGRSAAL